MQSLPRPWSLGPAGLRWRGEGRRPPKRGREHRAELADHEEDPIEEAGAESGNCPALIIMSTTRSSRTQPCGLRSLRVCQLRFGAEAAAQPPPRHALLQMARRAAERQPARRGAVLLLVAATARETLAAAGSCTGGWDCAELPAAVDANLCDVATVKPCAMLEQNDLDSLRNAEGFMDTAVLFEGCDELPQFQKFTRALEKQRLVDTYGSIKTRLAENIAGVWCAPAYQLKTSSTQPA
jgi:hypothetical protein